MRLQNQSFSEIASAAIEESFRALLESKHLYQSIDISISGFAHYIDSEAQKEISLQSQVVLGRGCSTSFFRSKEQISDDCRNKAVDRLKNTQCQMKFDEMPLQTGNFEISVPTIKAICQNPGCGGLWPHNACPDPSWQIPASNMPSGAHQIFVLRYQCQACKKEPVSFLVKREGLKLTLVGRSPMEAIDIPKFVPKRKNCVVSGFQVCKSKNKCNPDKTEGHTDIPQTTRSFYEQTSPAITPHPHLPPGK